jgi:predicted tellurium resistance membrane protein TerC
MVPELFTTEAMDGLLRVVMIDLTLAGDNAIVIGLAAGGLAREQRNKAILVGINAATGLCIVFAGGTIQLLQIVGLLFAGGILLLWVCWKMRRELSPSRLNEEAAARALMGRNAATGGTEVTSASRRTFARGRLADRLR